MKRYLFITPKLAGGGSEKVLLNLATVFAERGHDVHMIILEKIIDYDIPPGIHIHYLPAPRWLKTKRLREFLLNRFVKALSKRVGAFTLILSNFTSRRRVFSTELENKTYYYIHFDYLPVIEHERKHNPSAASKMLARIHGYYHNKNAIAVSNGVRDSLLTHIGARPKDLRVIYNCFDVDRVRQLAEEPNPQIPTDPYIIHVARFHLTQKRQDFLFEAVKKIKHDHKLVLLTEESEGLRALIRAHNLEDRVIVTGFQQNPYNWIRHADLMVLSSAQEGLTLVLIESLIVGTPAVSTDCPSGPAEILTGPLARWLTPVNDVDAFAAKVDEALDTTIEIPKTCVDPFDYRTVSQRYDELVPH